MKIARDDIIWRVVDGETLLLDGQTGYYFSLDEKGSELWTLLNELETIDAIVAELARTRSVDSNAARQLVDDLLVTLNAEKIIDESTYKILHSGAKGTDAGTYQKPVLKKYDQIDHVAIYGLLD